MAFGRYFEEYTVGEVVRHWPGRTISESDNSLFCSLTMNQHPLHLDANYAEGTQFGRQVVVGTLVFSLAVGMSVADMTGKVIAALEYEDVRHVAPTFIGDTIYAESEVIEKTLSESKDDRGVVYFATRVHNQRDKLVLTLRRRVLAPTEASTTPGSAQ